MASLYYIAVSYKYGIGNALSNIATIGIILIYAQWGLLSSTLAIVLEFISLMTIGGVNTIGERKDILILLAIGLGLNVLRVVKYNKDKKGSGWKVRDVLFTEYRPRKLWLGFRVIIYSLLISMAASIANQMGTVDGVEVTLLSSLWLILPIFSTIANILVISDMYLLRLMVQAVYMVIAYMSLAIGQAGYINLVSSIVMTITILIGLYDYRKSA